MTARRVGLSPMGAVTEAEWQGQVVDLARITGWNTMHVRRSIGKGVRWTTATSVIGWPDLAIWRPGAFMLVELKTQTGRLSPEQVTVLDSLRLSGVEVHVWRPGDMDAVVARLNKRKETAA